VQATSTVAADRHTNTIISIVVSKQSQLCHSVLSTVSLPQLQSHSPGKTAVEESDGSRRWVDIAHIQHLDETVTARVIR
jgi:hypothetical protein